MSAPLASCVDSVLDAWIRLIETHGVQMAPVAGLRSELSAWLDALSSPSLAERAELMRQVAMHARGLGAAGKPASAAVLQILLLEEALSVADCEPRPLVVPIREMIRVVADAHALGAASRLRREHQEVLGRAPVVTLPGLATIAFMVGDMDADLIDTMVGRLLRAAAGADAPRTILDVSGAPRDTDVFHRSLHGFATSPQFGRLELVVTGLEDPAATQARLDRLGTPSGRVHLFAKLQDALNEP